jgi:hypothetical protein
LDQTSWSKVVKRSFDQPPFHEQQSQIAEEKNEQGQIGEIKDRIGLYGPDTEEAGQFHQMIQGE